jgi:positive regulator of sigma E activity
MYIALHEKSLVVVYILAKVIPLLTAFLMSFLCLYLFTLAKGFYSAYLHRIGLPVF